MAEQQDRFAKMGADIVTVSTDSEHVYLASRHYEKELAKVGYLMGSDRQHAVASMFGVFDETSGRARRGRVHHQS